MKVWKVVRVDSMHDVYYRKDIICGSELVAWETAANWCLYHMEHGGLPGFCEFSPDEILRASYLAGRALVEFYNKHFTEGTEYYCNVQVIGEEVQLTALTASDFLNCK